MDQWHIRVPCQEKVKLFDILRELLFKTQSHEGPRYDLILCFSFSGWHDFDFADTIFL